ncbi:ATP-dependent zinc protease family protein [Aestuariispira insulae]|uniref:Retropepsin-like aspartic endopeptidase domain-containing protein n=1 Tax=Aestuariispira insulae TaxID=1461337 RepID=A0A3D9HJS9_9PROT|nr:RimK/LysX family protein [Aestuariispira insulae]RED49728.1 hypothetical protein DFP90_10599 [Aestuariispira insulae]
MKKKKTKTTVGWREWVAFPELGVPSINAKIDTGAKTSAIHAYRPRIVTVHEQEFVEFYVHPLQRRKKPEILCRAPLVDKRAVTSSNGQSQNRYVIRTTMVLGGQSKAIELTLTDRDEMSFRVLIGREALRGGFVVDPGRSYCVSGEKSKKGQS